MAGFDLPALARQQGRRRDITFRPIVPTQAMATDLAAIYAPAWRTWSENIDRILVGYDPKPLTDGLTRDDANAMQAAIDAVASEFLTRLVAQITPALRTFAIRAERIHRSRWAAAVNAGIGIDLSMVLTAQPVEETLSAWLARNVALAKNISDQAQSRIADAVFRGYQQRRPVGEVAKEIREVTGMGRRRAVNIAADQSSKLSGALDTERQVEAGIEYFRWRHSGKLHPREEHRARDGKVYEIKSGKERGGSGTVPADDRPGMAPFCGCRSQAWIELLETVEAELR